MTSILILANWQITLMALAFVLVCLFMMLVILIQKPKGGGLSGAFGGAGGSAQAAFGAKTGDVLTWFTCICFALFLLLAMGLTWTIRPEHEQYVRDLEAEQQAADFEEALERTLRLQTPMEDTSNPAAAANTEGMAPPVEQTNEPAPVPAAPAAPAPDAVAPNVELDAPAPEQR